MLANVGENGAATVVPVVPTAGSILADAYLRDLYTCAYDALADLVRTAPRGPVVEVGAGRGLARRLGHHWLLSDLQADPGIDLVLDACSLPFANRSVSALVLKDALHHCPDPEDFLDEADRVLHPGGLVAVFDPYWGPLARLVYRHLHHEPFDDRCVSWSFPASSPWSSNQAITYLMLVRDRARLEHRWPHLAVEMFQPLVGPSFLLSGGVSRRTPVHGGVLSAMLRWEQRRGRWFDAFRFFHIFALRKMDDGASLT